MALLEVRDLRTYFYTSKGVVKAVDGISFDVEAGETLALVGESGCGKSVTARSLMRIVPSPPAQIVSGSVMFDGQDVLAMGESEIRRMRGRQMAMILQDPMSSLNPVLTIGRQITGLLRFHLALSRRAADARAIELLEMVGIANAATRLDDYPHRFSGGMRQRVLIAMALACEPKLILADEITTALDVTIQAQILELLQDLSQQMNTAIVLITHDLGIVARMASRVHVMYAGRIVEKVGATELYKDPRMPYTWGLLQSIPRMQDELGARLAAIRGVPPNPMATAPGCWFEERCDHAREICGQQEPLLVAVPGGREGHEVRCWATQDDPRGGWLVDSRPPGRRTDSSGGHLTGAHASAADPVEAAANVVDR